MNAQLDELYLRWLYKQISPISIKNPERTYWLFARDLFQKEFIWFVPNDDNRYEDGRDLRYEFLFEEDIDEDSEWLSLGCSMLELLVALSRRFAFMWDGEPRDRFWELVENTGIEKCNDKHYKEDDDLKLEIDQIMDSIIWRTYEPNGHGGGLFPLEHPTRDQTKIELWYQMADYVNEKEGDY